MVLDSLRLLSTFKQRLRNDIPRVVYDLKRSLVRCRSLRFLACDWFCTIVRYLNRNILFNSSIHSIHAPIKQPSKALWSQNILEDCYILVFRKDLNHTDLGGPRYSIRICIHVIVAPPLVRGLNARYIQP